MLTLCKEQTKVWKVVNQNSLQPLVTLPGTEEGGSSSKHKPIACISNDGSTVVVYRGSLIFTVYELKDDGKNAVKKDVIDL